MANCLQNSPMNLKDTLNLPQTAFPMRGDLVQREPERLAHWERERLYEKIQARREDCPTFILHDGPPFTNGDVHLGTALNKILKDTILRFKSMRGYRTPYVPGWDCHGLPIEHKVALRLRAEGRDLAPAALREECAAFSAGFIETQRAQFQRLGVLADWGREYKTMNPAYEAQILRTFAAFVEHGLVYRSKKPVYWSIPCGTALAEAEVEYHAHATPAIYVGFAVEAGAADRYGLPEGTEVVIWTTTPWTIPANLAIAVHPDLTYVVVRETTAVEGTGLAEVGHQPESQPTDSGRYFLVAEALWEGVAKKTGRAWEVVKRVAGRDLEHLPTRHPLIDRPSPVVLANYVTTEAGTGCVHTAPGHGMEDYLTGLAYGLEIYCPLDDAGCYLDDGQVPPELVGVSVLETDGKCPANIEVLKLLQGTGALLGKENHRHQYPHCWRSKTPVIFRAMDQWFVGLDRHETRQRVLAAIEKVSWVPEWGVKRIRAAVENRPDWCISRQRSWGVPLPVFYRPDGEALLDAGVIRHLADVFERQGSTAWFQQTVAELLAGAVLPEGFSVGELVAGRDTLDVWIDSGCSHRAVLAVQEGLSWPADLYLEGSDQHRGWFQSSLWTAMIADGAPPFRQVLTHGFIVEETGEKISKSKGAMSSDQWVQAYGADLVRLWVASQDFRGDIKLSKDQFEKNVRNTYRSLRNTLLYQLGNLSDFDRARDAVPLEALEPLDQWALGQLALFLDRVTEAYDRFEFHRVYQEVDNFVGVTLSRLYHDMLKDRLYTYGRTWVSRRSAQTVVDEIFRALVRVLAPILTFTADEAWSYYRAGQELAVGESVHLQDWPVVPEEWRHLPAVEPIGAILSLRDVVNEALEGLRREKAKSLDGHLIFTVAADSPLREPLERFREALPELFIVSQVSIEVVEDITSSERFLGSDPLGGASSGHSVAVRVERATGERCPRSWRWVPELVSAGAYGRVSPRDRDALLSP